MNKRLFRRRRADAAATLKDIARELDLSVSVVSRALNPKPDANARVSAATLRAVRRTADRLGFKPNRAADFLRRGKAATIGIFLPDKPDRLTADLMIGLSEGAATAGFPLHFYFGRTRTDQDYAQFADQSHDLSHSGIITYAFDTSPASPTGRWIRQYREKGGHVILLNQCQAPPGFTGVSIDNHTGGRLVARRLVERVCKAYFTDGVYRWRTEGFLAELQAAGVAGKVSLDLGAGAGAAEQNPPGGEHPIGAFDAARFARAVEEYRAGGGEWPIGIFATTDVVACAVLRLLRDLALTPGREALLIGYDDQFLTGHLLPALTTVHQPFRDEGRLAARKMIRLIYGGEEVSESVAPYLVIRETA